MKTQIKDLKPCPFCGGKAVLKVSTGLFNLWREYRVECPYCDDEYWVLNDEKRAIDKWNERIEDAKIK